MRRNEIVGGMAIFLFGLATVILSLRMPIGTFRAAGTGLFPLGLGIALMALSGLFLLQQVLKKQSAREKETAAVVPNEATGQLLYFSGVVVLATLFFNRLGFPLFSFILMAGLLRVLGVRRWPFNLTISFITAVFSYLVFVQWLKIPLPRGWPGL
ncbi:MAG: tripartite tricarboxylate transporter TctB family protein [Thermodesulfobacteriota bacterium]